MSDSFDGAVLCGGRSRRMGRDKALVEIDGVPMASRVASALTAAGATTVVAVGGDHERLGAVGLDHEADEHPGEGPLGALVTALHRVGTEAVVAVLGCDLVAPSPPVIAGLAARLDAGDADAVVPLVDGRPQWMHAVWRRRVSGVLTAVFASGERSLFGAVHGLDIDFHGVDAVAPFRDADTPDDLPRER